MGEQEYVPPVWCGAEIDVELPDGSIQTLRCTRQIRPEDGYHNGEAHDDTVFWPLSADEMEPQWHRPELTAPEVTP